MSDAFLFFRLQVFLLLLWRSSHFFKFDTRAYTDLLVQFLLTSVSCS